MNRGQVIEETVKYFPPKVLSFFTCLFLNLYVEVTVIVGEVQPTLHTVMDVIFQKYACETKMGLLRFVKTEMQSTERANSVTNSQTCKHLKYVQIKTSFIYGQTMDGGENES